MKAAIKNFNGLEFKNRSLRIKKAVEKKRLDKKKRKFIDQKEANKSAAMQRINKRNDQEEELLPPIPLKPTHKDSRAPKKERTMPSPSPITSKTKVPLK